MINQQHATRLLAQARPAEHWGEELPSAVRRRVAQAIRSDASREKVPYTVSHDTEHGWVIFMGDGLIYVERNGGPFRERPYQVAAYNYNLFSWRRMIQGGQIDLNPPYQRGLVWDYERRVRLIDSLLVGLGVPPIYLRELDETRLCYLEVIDGKQRLSTLMAFMDDEFPYAGVRFSELEAVDRRCLCSITVGAVQVKHLTDEQVVEIFWRLNFCGVPQDPRREDEIVAMRDPANRD